MPFDAQAAVTATPPHPDEPARPDGPTPADGPAAPSGRPAVRGVVVLVVLLLAVGSCTAVDRAARPGSGDAAPPTAAPAPAASPSPTARPPAPPATPAGRWAPAPPADPGTGTAVVADEPAAAAARALLGEVPVVVVVPADDGVAVRVGAWLGLRLRAPVLPAAPATSSTGAASPAAAPAVVVPHGDGLPDLAGVEVVVVVGDVDPASLPRGWREADVRALDTSDAPRSPVTDQPPALAQLEPGGLLAEGVVPARPDLDPIADLLDAADAAAPDTAAAVPPAGVALVDPDDDGALLAVVTARAGGWLVTATDAVDPRADPALRATLTAGAGTPAALPPDAPAVVLGTTAGAPDPALLDARLATVRRGLELPGGGQLLLPGRRLVALYGTPGTGALGLLGEQDVAASIERVRALAAEFEAADPDGPAVLPTFEIITTVASSAPEPTGDYSRRVPLEVLRPWVDAAGEAGVYVVLDLQPGRTDFVTQAQEYAELLREPHVGLALDPEWRLRPDQVHLRQVGQVGVEEVQATADWLAALVREEALPQKLLLLHQFQLRMLPDRERLVTPPELVTVVQMDGQGSQPAKLDTWRVLTTSPAPAGALFGWKNFLDEDLPTRSVADTVTLDPAPVFVSYQ
ncbi:MAG: hypothetical protein ACLGIR_07625 [Actinomycetes bacterium]